MTKPLKVHTAVYDGLAYTMSGAYFQSGPAGFPRGSVRTAVHFMGHDDDVWELISGLEPGPYSKVHSEADAAIWVATGALPQVDE